MTEALSIEALAETVAALAALPEADRRAAVRAQVAAVAALAAEDRMTWRDAMVPALISKGDWDTLIKAALKARRVEAVGKMRAGQPPADRPQHLVNMTGAEFRYSTGADGFPRGVYEYKRTDGSDDRYWQPRADLPHVHARVIRRDGSGRRTGTEYLISGTETGPRALVSNDDLTTGAWADRVDIDLSSDRTIITAAGTALRHMAHRYAPQVEATPRPDAYTPEGRLDLPYQECLPDGYLRTPPGSTEASIRAAWAELVAILAVRDKMALAVGAAMFGPFVGPLRRQAHWMDFYGAQRMGKTTALGVAASVWGDPRTAMGIVTAWNTSAIGSGRHLGQLGILPVFMDERGMTSFTPAEWGEMVYTTCQGNSRLTAEVKGTGTRRSLPWSGTLFSTGNHRLTEGADAGRFAGVPARVIELPAPFTRDAAESDRIFKADGAADGLVFRAYGWLGPQGIQRFTVADARAMVAEAEATLGVPGLGGQPRTIGEHLAGAVAGARMVDAVLGTGSMVSDAAARAALDYLAAHSAPPTTDADRMLAAIAEAMASTRGAWPTEAEYVALGSPRPDNYPGPSGSVLAAHGYASTLAGVVSPTGVYVFPATWAEMCSATGCDSSLALTELYRRGALHVAESARRAGEWTHRPRIDGGRLPHGYVIRRDAIEPPAADAAAMPVPGPTPAPAPAPAPAPVDVAPVETAPAAPAAATVPAPRDPRPGPAARRSNARAGRLAEDVARLDAGKSPRLLDALETTHLPRKRVDGRMRGAFLTAEMPHAAHVAHVVTGYSWTRPYDGPAVVLDRSGAWVAAASSVTVAHGELEHTGERDYAGRPGYYLVDVFPWLEAETLPGPLDGARVGERVWVPGPTVGRLVELADAGRWPDATVYDSYTGEPVRLTDWTDHVKALRDHTITTYGRDDTDDQAPYVRVKRSFGQAMSMMLGTPAQVGLGREWPSLAKRMDWTHAIQAQASATLHRWADHCLTVAPGLGPVAVRNVDELVIPAAALDIVTAAPRRNGGPLVIDQAGIRLGSFKVKATEGER